MKTFIIIFSIFLVLIILFLIINYITFHMAFDNKKRNPEDLTPIQGKQYDPYQKQMKMLIDDANKIPYEKVSTTSYDGLKLCGKYYHIKDNAPLYIQFHGYKSNAIRDFSGGIQLAIGLNCNVLLVDQRAHGYSEGNVISFGIKERKDVLTWIHYAIERFGKETKILLNGISMGAATVLMASNLDLPSNVLGIVADCPYSSPKEIIMDVTKKMKIPPNLAYPFLYMGAIIYGHFNMEETSASECVKDSKVPILLIHGMADHFVPVELSEKIYEQNKEKITFLQFKDAPHGLSFLLDYNRYFNAVKEFQNKLIKESD